MHPRVLSIDQPWAWAITAGIRPIVSRLWPEPTMFTGPVLIYAARKRFDFEGSSWLIEQGYEVPRELPRGAIVGRVQLASCVADATARRVLSRDYHGWMTDDPHAVHLVFTAPEIAPNPLPITHTRAALGKAPAGWKAAFESPAEAS